ncbi:MAG TPA: aspartyl/asparaginyl beta-hydroxylase domain-containing protein, partial [Candidatus Acidoferrum sp.]|nr:aspartyl/asparaginyl beta-hydroxylase domain-containing protein [Candidatus Acidoferrum sp.]
MKALALTRYLKLPFSFDVERMQRELRALEQAEWSSHFNTAAYQRGWSCLPLRSVGGRSDHVIPIDDMPYADTALLDACPYLRSVIDSFACEKTSIRLMAMEPGAVIREHRDEHTALEDGITRLHIPIVTDPAVLFRIDGEAVHFSEGDTWYLNASCRHAVTNASAISRVHLMMDCITNDWLREKFVEAGWVKRARSFEMSRDEKRMLRATRCEWTPDWNPAQWLPVALDVAAGTLWWRHRGERRLTAPFFIDNFVAQSTADRLVCETPLSALDTVGRHAAPALFIFHVSRCGSTLLTQMLAELKEWIAIPEAPVLDAFFRYADLAGDEQQRRQLFGQLLAAFGQCLNDECHLAVKFDSWHLPWLGWVRRQFPQVPVVLLYRDPLQVLASHAREPGSQLIPGLIDTGLLQPETEDLAPADLQGYAQCVLDALFREAERQSQTCIDDATTGAPLLLVNHAELPAALWQRVLPGCGIAVNDAQSFAMQQRARHHGKHAARLY